MKSEFKFTLRLSDGSWISSPTNATTTDPQLARVFTADDEQASVEQRLALEATHGLLEIVPWHHSDAGEAVPVRHDAKQRPLEEPLDWVEAQAVISHIRAKTPWLPVSRLM